MYSVSQSRSAGANVWTTTIETFDETGTTNLGGAIQKNANTLFRATHSNSGGPVGAIGDIWGINRIQPTLSTGDDKTEMSSENDPPSDQLLIPSTGTRLNVTLVSGNVVMECLIDGDLVESDIDYDLSSEIKDAALLLFTKQTETGVIKTTEGGANKNLE